MPVADVETFDFRACRIEGSDRPIAILGPDLDGHPCAAEGRVDPLLGDGGHADTGAAAALAT